MKMQSIIDPGRRALNPILSDDVLMISDGGSEAMFYTPLANRINESLDLIVAMTAGLFLLAAWVFSLADAPLPLVHLFTLFAFASAGLPALIEVWKKLLEIRIDIDLLMVLGALLAAYIGSPFEGALLLFLFALSGAMETFSLRRTQSAITALRDLSPQDAIVLRDGVATRVPLRYVNLGDRVLVRPGELIPVDGVVIAGQSSVNEAAITGESVPRDCSPGDKTFAGTQNLNGRLEIEVGKTAADTTLARIVDMVTKARRHPARAQRLIDRIGPTYSIVVIAAALLVGLANAMLFNVDGAESVRRGIAVLIVASPCALIIATPVAYLSAIAAAARRGVLIKGGSYLEILARAKVVAFDKTGTLTTGKPRVTDIVPPDGMLDTEFLRLVGALEHASNHPIAEAVTRALHDRGIQTPTVTEYLSSAGVGVEGIVDNHRLWIGKPEGHSDRAENGQLETVAERISALRHEGKTVSLVTVDGKAGLIAFEDAPRDGVVDALQRLRKQGVVRLEMLTGDHETAARRVAESLHLNGFQAQLAPEDKLTASARIREKYGPIVLVGDGINDAPALATADAGIAMGAFGADIAMEAAHVVLMKDNINLVAWLHGHARRTARIVKQNLTLAIAVIAVLSVFAALGEVPLPLAVVGHEGSTVIVAFNALRLLRTRK